MIGWVITAVRRRAPGDRLIGVTGGRAVAAAVPDAHLVTYPGWGHDLPEPLWPRFVDEIAQVVSRGERQRAAAGPGE